MAVTTQSLTHTPIPGHSFPSANKKRQFTKWVEAKEHRRYRFTEYVPRTMDKPEQIEYETGQSYNPPIWTLLGGATTNNSATITVTSTQFIRVGDTYRITDYYAGSSTELNHATREYGSVLAITNGTQFVANRHEGAVASGSWAVHPTSSRLDIISRGISYASSFIDGITWRGDILTNYCQRFDSGEIPYDIFAARSVPTYESDKQMVDDIAKWTDRLKEYRDSAFVEGRKAAGNYTANPQVPYKLGGAIWWAEQRSANVFPVNGILSMFDVEDALAVKWEEHMDGPGTDMWMGPKTRACIDSLLLPVKEGRLSDTVYTNKLTGMNFTWADLKVEHTLRWPEGTILICAKNTFAWNNAEGMDWEKFETRPENNRSYVQSWNMSGDFGFTCNDVQRPILLTGIDTRKDNYLGRNLGL